jgi:hypothetical protein
MLGFLFSAVRNLFRRKPKIGGWFDVECVNADGSIAWRDSFPNGTTTGGLTDRLNVAFAAAAQHTQWFLGLIDNSGFSALAVGDTMASHAGWAESVAYNEATRVQWTPLTVAASSAVNSSVCAFTINGSVTIYGIFLCSVSTKNGTTGILWATGAFSSPQALVNTQVLNVTYRHTDA